MKKSRKSKKELSREKKKKFRQHMLALIVIGVLIAGTLGVVIYAASVDTIPPGPPKSLTID